MEPRLKYWRTSPEVLKAMTALQNVVNAGGLEKKLVDLAYLRASQINGMRILHGHAHQRP